MKIFLDNIELIESVHFVEAKVPRAMPTHEFWKLSADMGFELPGNKNEEFVSITDTLNTALSAAEIMPSTFAVELIIGKHALLARVTLFESFLSSDVCAS